MKEEIKKALLFFEMIPVRKAAGNVYFLRVSLVFACFLSTLCFSTACFMRIFPAQQCWRFFLTRVLQWTLLYMLMAFYLFCAWNRIFAFIFQFYSKYKICFISLSRFWRTDLQAVHFIRALRYLTSLLSLQVKRDLTARMDDIQEANLRTMADLDARVVSLARTLQAHVDECDRRLNMVRACH